MAAPSASSSKPRRCGSWRAVDTSHSTYAGYGAPSGSDTPGNVAHREFDRDARQVFERRDAVARGFAQAREQIDRGLHAGHRDERGLDRAWLREQLQACGGDDPERAFRADEEVAQVIPRVVLAQARQAVDDATVGQHDLEAQHQIARHAVAHGREPAGIGREIAADLATAFRAERQRKQPVDGLRGRLHVQQHAARFRDQREVGGVDFADAVQPVQRQHELIAARARRGAAAVTGVAALRHDGDARRRCRARAPAQLPRSSPDTQRTAWRRGTGRGNPSGSAPSVRVRRCSPPGPAGPGCAGARRRANRVRLPASGPATLRPCGARRPSPRPARRRPRRPARGSRRARW